MFYLIVLLIACSNLLDEKYRFKVTICKVIKNASSLCEFMHIPWYIHVKTIHPSSTLSTVYNSIENEKMFL